MTKEQADKIIANALKTLQDSINEGEGATQEEFISISLLVAATMLGTAAKEFKQMGGSDSETREFLVGLVDKVMAEIGVLKQDNKSTMH